MLIGQEGDHGRVIFALAFVWYVGAKANGMFVDATAHACHYVSSYARWRLACHIYKRRRRRSF